VDSAARAAAHVWHVLEISDTSRLSSAAARGDGVVSGEGGASEFRDDDENGFGSQLGTRDVSAAVRWLGGVRGVRGTATAASVIGGVGGGMGREIETLVR
jgi:hypothetical protein